MSIEADMLTVWEFIWQNYHYYVAATDANAALEYLRREHPDIADDALDPRNLGRGPLGKLKLKEGEVHCTGEVVKFER
jgi:hypothetical protein